MIFADKLINLRKKNNWSQEELAEKMNVTRQSVSKWEGAQSVPDLEKIIKLSQIFGVSLDYLLKEEIEDEEYFDYEEETRVRKFTLEEMHEYVKIRFENSKNVATGVYLSIISSVPLLLLLAISESKYFPLTDNMATSFGLILLIIFISISVALFITSSNKEKKYEFMETEIFDTAYGVDDLTREMQNEYKDYNNKQNIIGVVLCILAVIPIFVTIITETIPDYIILIMVATTLIIVGTGVYILVKNSIVSETYDRILQENDYTIDKKENPSVAGKISTIYWLISVAIYLGYSFTTNNWDKSWIIITILAVLYPALMALINIVEDKNK
ncbi:transcriptional regulator with XRE-family HTH domain/multisubunit Na+/H+ antiporter MnhG subunit [Peptoniphilus olsenii]|uniref:Transcriptional regulator with XRE-family HTH domain/multisubunit Na+/H+ antiporter MnhG subunit n=1 Tax=Peptoniphilus olsenii TaxID=411570 RepID=A0ABV2JA06_9FIRM